MLCEEERAAISAGFIETLMQVPAGLYGFSMEEINEKTKSGFPEFFKQNFSSILTEQMAVSFMPDVLYHITDFAGLNFNLFLYENNRRIFLAGPYLTHQPDSEFTERVLQNNGLNLSLLLPLRQFYLSLTVIGNSAMLSASRKAMRVITGCGEEIPYQHYLPQDYYRREVSNLSPEGVDEAHMELLEHRYYYEKLFLEEVRQGNQDKALEYYQEFISSSRSIVRTEDPLRTLKNLGFSLNTMLRKSAEGAGIHPVFLDIISSNFAMLLENCTNTEEVRELDFHMVSAYCRFVRKQRLDQYSPIVRKAAAYIRIHLADPLTLPLIAAGIKISPSYLSRTFNQETGDSISNYITEARIEKAAELLSFSQMPIQNIAAYVGFNDLNYFSRCFKKSKGATPTKWRQTSAVGAPYRQPEA